MEEDKKKNEGQSSVSSSTTAESCGLAPLATSGVIPSFRLSELANVVEEKKQIVKGQNANAFVFEMEILQQLTFADVVRNTYSCSNALMAKNRYVNVLPSNSHRVKLAVQGEDPDSDYINACLVPPGVLPGTTTAYVAAQAPVPSAIGDWWRMVWERKISLVVMLTNLTEDGRTKAHLYWPDEGKALQTEELFVVPAKEAFQVGDTVVRTFKVYPIGNVEDSIEVTQLHYVAWPDHGVPSNYESTVSLLKLYRQFMEGVEYNAETQEHPVIIHCSAGIGRTGCMIAADIILEYLQAARASGQQDPELTVFDVLVKLRGFRGGMVQTVVQYKFIHGFVQHCLEEGHLLKSDSS
jgi:protein tyrosine phosphatase